MPTEYIIHKPDGSLCGGTFRFLLSCPLIPPLFALSHRLCCQLDRGMGYVERETKTKADRRKIILTRVVLEALKEHEVRKDSSEIE